MAETFRVGVLGAGWAGLAHARGYLAAGGYKLDAVCDLIPARVAAFKKEFPTAREYESAELMIKDPGIDVLSICLPTDLHAVYAVKALRAKKHVVLESPPALDVKGMRAILRAAEKAGKVVLPAFQRRYGSHEAAARQAIEKGYAGDVYHSRASWHRPGGVPQGARTAAEPTGWYTDPARSGGGALMDLGLPLLEVAWSLLGYPAPESVLAITHNRLTQLPVEEAGTVLVRFKTGASLEISSAWAIRTSPNHYGISCRIHGTAGAVEVYTPEGATLYRGEGDKLKPTLLKGPKTIHYPALMRELKSLAAQAATTAPTTPDAPTPSYLLHAQHALTLMRLQEAIYKSAKSGKSADVRDA